MTYTFDEAIEELRLSIPERFYSPTMHDIAVMIEAQNKVINLLREEYAPTVEMTKKQYNAFKWYKDNLDFSTCLEKFQNYNGETRMGIKFDDLKGELSDDDLMQSWLHPETIKVVDE